ncbi:signal peptide peptidase SppA [Desulfobaculum bizertense]|uniref:Protease-4 n=1 Tax=Desulfobaculum bizertense DSM 18034 TaxID=1121442 RepID=A0A1T4WKB4_9BACT|nr:signal peptide peptidase SppA [Desulfobaculum bizertense]UIJ37143.1 signal peptide peptidase SppA [Desulfobaculum bizertense]SKA77348.1 protease-4 [Desulfobaculum bizertense DSM 18034]
MLIILAVALFSGAAAFFHSTKLSDRLSSSDDQIGIVRVEGVIMDSESLVEWIRDLRNEPSVKGVLIRVNSPGGAVTPSQEISRAVARLAKQKPVVVSMSSAAASGGYYISAPATCIFANPSTITGSIGVIMELTNVADLMEKIGVKRQSLTSGKLKGAGTPFRKMTRDEREYLQSIVDDMHDQFVRAVAKGRHMDLKEVRAIADGRVFTGRQARTVGLVDKLGGMEDAAAELKSLCGLSGSIPTVEQPEKKRPFIERIMSNIHITLDATGLPQGLLVR